jgi:hypothetical protein
MTEQENEIIFPKGAVSDRHGAYFGRYSLSTECLFHSSKEVGREADHQIVHSAGNRIPWICTYTYWYIYFPCSWTKHRNISYLYAATMINKHGKINFPDEVSTKDSRKVMPLFP